jgi:dihydrofolate reductase
MTAFIIAALTADGFIAKSSQHLTDWTSKEDKHFFVEKTKQAGVVVFGQNTFETIGKPLKDRLTIVYSKDKQYEGVEVTQKPPRELLEDLEKRGYKEVAICGGATIYTIFMEAGVVDKLYLSVEPVLFGQGLTLFNKELDKKLELVSVQKLGDHTVLLEYNVIK